MESRDVGSPIGAPHPEQASPPATPQIVDGDADLWTQFAQAATVEAFCRSGLALQCRKIPGVAGGLLLLGPPDRGPFSPAAVWPSPRRDMKYLAATAERALIQRHGLVIKRKPDPEGGARERFDVAYPIEVAGHLHGVVVRAVSHSAEFRKQANLIRAIAAAMDEAVDQQMALVHPAPSGAGAAVTRAQSALAREGGAGAVCSVPVAAGGRVVGGLTLERPADRPFDPPTVEVCEAIAALAGPVLELQRREDRCLIAKAADATRGQLAQIVGPRHIGRKLAVLGLAIAVAVLATARGDYRLSAPSVMEAGIQRAAVAPFNGYIAEALARAGDIVRQGQVLCVLDDRDLRLERLKWLSQQEQFVKQYHEAMAKRSAAQVNILTAQIDQAKAQLALLDDQLSRTRLVAPFDGIVVKGDLSQSLGAPVERSQVLFEVAPLETYRVVLQVDERDVANVAVGQKGQLLLAAAPMEGLPFTVEKVTPVSTAREGRNSFRVEARLQSTPEHLRPGMEGVGKIEVDRRLLIWIWTHQVIDWVRLMVWKWLP